MRLLHLGLGNFFRAHQASYTAHASDAARWGIAGFSGRAGTRLVDDLNRQQGLYTLITRAADADRFEVLGSLSRAHPGADHEAWLGYFADPSLAAVTVTVTEAGYVRGADGGLDAGRPEVRADVASLRRDWTSPVRTAPARLLAGIWARGRADAGPIALVPCDNLAGNGAILERVLRDLAERVEPGLAARLAESAAVVTTMVDRITPRTTPQDVEAVREATGAEDRCPVVTEPFAEWVLSGRFPAGRPRWEEAGATFTEDVTPYEQRKLWLLNGAHSLLAYTGSVRGHETVAEAVADPSCRQGLEQWWSEATRHLDPAGVAAYRAALLDRFANARMRHRLDQIAADGSQKLPIRILPVLRAERMAGRDVPGATGVLAGWVCHLRGFGAAVTDVRAEEMRSLAAGQLDQAVPRLLDALDPALGDDRDVAGAVVEQCWELCGTRARARARSGWRRAAGG